MPLPKNIYIVGAPCTGKTTLLRGLQKHFAEVEPKADVVQPATIAEVARAVLLQLDINRDDIGNSPNKCQELQSAILEAQSAAESRLSQKGQWYISDRSGLDPIVFAQLYVGQEAAENLLQSPAWQSLEHNMREGVVILCESGCSWLTDDGTRLMPRDVDEWRRFDRAFVELLRQSNIEYTLLSKDMVSIEERVDLVAGIHAQS